MKEASISASLITLLPTLREPGPASASDAYADGQH